MKSFGFWKKSDGEKESGIMKPTDPDGIGIGRNKGADEDQLRRNMRENGRGVGILSKMRNTCPLPQRDVRHEGIVIWSRLSEPDKRMAAKGFTMSPECNCSVP